MKVLIPIFLSFVLLAQANTAQNEAGASGDATAAETITGCLVKGDPADHFRFAAADGRVWNVVLPAKHAETNPYVGHVVTVRGKLTPNLYSTKDKSNAEVVKRSISGNNAGTLTIIDLGTAGESCRSDRRSNKQ